MPRCSVIVLVCHIAEHFHLYGDLTSKQKHILRYALIAGCEQLIIYKDKCKMKV